MDCEMKNDSIYVIACLILQYLIIMRNDNFNASWIYESQIELQRNVSMLQKVVIVRIYYTLGSSNNNNNAC